MTDDNDDRALPDTDPDVQRLKLAHIADQFFVEALPPREPKPVDRHASIKAELRALKAFAKAMQKMEPAGRRAALRWLLSIYGEP